MPGPSPIDLLVPARRRSLAPGMSVGRVLPWMKRRAVGPFVFLDHMGPVVKPPGQGMDVGPHPHIGLATVTYLFEGRVHHRDSLGSSRIVEPGDVHWMTAGRGIVHSERTPAEDRQTESRLHGLQAWVALPLEHEECAPDFRSYPAHTLPALRGPGLEGRVLLGEAFGLRSPVQTFGSVLYVELRLQAGAEVRVAPEAAEQGLYVVEGGVEIEDEAVPASTLAVLAARPVTVLATVTTRLMLLGGAPLDAPRSMFWNFVSSDPARIEAAKRTWRLGGFGGIAGELEVAPMPEG